ncbi:MAG: carbon monoxide dehydrogenase beta subunit family protein [Candidatus Bathyarchaeia archaeon]
MWRSEPWMKAEVPGTRRATIIEKPELAAELLKQGGRILMVCGDGISTVLSKRSLLDYIVDVAEAVDAHIATSSTVYVKIKSRLLNTAWISPVEVANKASDPEWMGLDGKGAYKTLVVVGLPYYMAWLILTGLKNFAQSVKTISLDRFYQPNASWSLRNMNIDEWERFLEDLVNKLKV